MKRNRYLLKAHGDDSDALKVALMKFLELLGGGKLGVIVVPNLQAAKGGLLESALGEKLAKQLVKDREINLDNGAKICLCSSATFKSFRSADVYCLLWGAQSMLESVEELDSWGALIELTWLEKDAAYWSEKYSPVVIYP